MSNWIETVFEICQWTYAQDRHGGWGVYKAQSNADVLWTLWEDADGTKHARVVRGRDLTGPDLRHAGHVCENEDQAIHHAEDHGDEIPLQSDGKTLAVPEPAVPEHHVAMLLSGRFLNSEGLRLTHDGRMSP